MIFVALGTAAAFGEIQPQAFDLAVIRDVSTLETRIVQDWKPDSKG